MHQTGGVIGAAAARLQTSFPAIRRAAGFISVVKGGGGLLVFRQRQGESSMHASSTQSGKAGITVAPTGGALGAEIRHADLRAIDDGDFALIRGAWHDHLVAVFRGQELSDEALIAFSRRFGELDWAPVQEA